MPLQAGTVCEILKAYSAETASRSIVDELAHCECSVLRDTGGADVLVYVRARGECWVSRLRLRPTLVVH
jgi:hypothetical protein